MLHNFNFCMHITVKVQTYTKILYCPYFQFGNIRKLCLYEIKHSNHIWEPEGKQNKISIDMKVLLNRDVVCETYKHRLIYLFW